MGCSYHVAHRIGIEGGEAYTATGDAARPETRQQLRQSSPTARCARTRYMSAVHHP